MKPSKCHKLYRLRCGGRDPTAKSLLLMAERIHVSPRFDEWDSGFTWPAASDVICGLRVKPPLQFTELLGPAAHENFSVGCACLARPYPDFLFGRDVATAD